MPPKPFVDLDSIDLTNLVAGPEEIRRHNPQRYEMEHLDGVAHLDMDAGLVVGFKDVRDDEFWVRGHIPGRPLLPGVLMCEAAAQLCSYYFNKAVDTDKFLGFGGMEEVKFRRPVAPGDRFIIVARVKELRPRRAVLECQGFVDGRMVFEGTIIGMPMR
ncbi:MAG: beta-hydroxyacyl-ACP dehydratase [Planctomycetes bacterium]|nr:beta-hydroxyacyl-ACP dehydratase [Planctomycetota bacterium]